MRILVDFGCDFSWKIMKILVSAGFWAMFMSSACKSTTKYVDGYQMCSLPLDSISSKSTYLQANVINVFPTWDPKEKHW